MKKINQQKHITILLPSLGGGGAERVMVNLARFLNSDRLVTSLVTISDRGVYHSIVPPQIMYKSLHAGRARWAIINLLLYFFRSKKTDIVFVNLPQTIILFWIVAGIRKLFFLKKIVFVPILHALYSRDQLQHKRLHRWFFKMALHSADAIVCISRSMQEDLIRHLDISSKKIWHINNLHDREHVLSEAQKKSVSKSGSPLFIAVGRLTYQKNYPLLIRAFAEVKKIMHQARLEILGEGEDRVLLEALVKNLHLQDSVTFLGFQKNPYVYIRRADGLVLSSLWEGLPTVVIEALDLGVPVVSTDCESGPREILDNGKYGILVPSNDEKALAEGMIDLINRSWNPQELSRRGNDFSPQKIISAYQALINYVT